MAPTVLAVGAWLKNAACLVLDGRAHWSPVHGDLSDPVACAALEASVQTLLAQAVAAGAPVQAVAHDLHPDFFSTQLALRTAEALGVPAIGVQHHHAHLAAVLAEHGLSGPVVGLALDGVGLGVQTRARGLSLGVSPDVGTPEGFSAWGGELLWLDGAQWQRLGHLWPLALPGGDRAAREPWRMAASALHALGRADEIGARFGPAVGEAMAKGVRQMLDKGLNCPLTSSAGRWFDAAAGALGACAAEGIEAKRVGREPNSGLLSRTVAGATAGETGSKWDSSPAVAADALLPRRLLGLCLRQQDEAQAAIALEQAASRALAAQPDLAPLPGAVVHADGRIDLRPVLAPLFDAADVDTAAAGFHLALADALAEALIAAARAREVRTAVLGGGCFYNRILRQRVERRLRDAGLTVLQTGAPGCGDAGLAIGQAWVAAQTLSSPSSASHSFSVEETLSCA